MPHFTTRNSRKVSYCKNKRSDISACCGLMCPVMTASKTGYICSHSLTAISIICSSLFEKSCSLWLMMTECLNMGILWALQNEKCPSQRFSLTNAKSSKTRLQSEISALMFIKHEMCRQRKCCSQATNKSILFHLPSISTATSFSERRSKAYDFWEKTASTASMGLISIWTGVADNTFLSSCLIICFHNKTAESRETIFLKKFSTYSLKKKFFIFFMTQNQTLKIFVCTFFILYVDYRCHVNILLSNSIKEELYDERF